MRYRAFLSYSHADARWARWLLRRLEGYRVPSRLVGSAGVEGPIPARLGTVFRDRDELPSAGDLSDTIRAALAQSSALVVLCSPAAAQSQWVNAEIEAFRAGRPDARVLCFIVDGDPHSDAAGRDCFPPALLQAGADGVRHEPLAADARREGDGRERALLKLVAGLLGVGYDTLARREAQRRQRRLLAVTAASLLGMAVTLALAATAWVARNDAQRRQAQAEDILGFMLGDLRGKLATVGRLDLMQAVDDKATGYFATLDPRDLSDRALEEQARSLTGIGRVRLDAGNHPGAMTAFREAHARSTALRERDPDDGQRLFDLAQAEYWIGFVALQQGRLEDAATWFGQYRDSAIVLAAMDPANFDWQREVAYGHHNLAVLDERRGRHAAAERAMRQELALYRTWVAQRPGDLELRYEAANVASWLGSLALGRGRLAEAEALFLEQADAMGRSVDEAPRDARWKEQRVNALLLLADTQAQRGRLAGAHASIEAVSRLAEELSAQDAANNYWRSTLGMSRWWQAQLAAREHPAEAARLAARAVEILAVAHATEPGSQHVLSWLARARHLQARLALAGNDVTAARAHLAATRALLEPAWREQPNETLRLWLARTLLLEGQAARQDGNAADARAAWTGARRLLLADAGAPVPFARLDPLVRTMQGLGQHAEAAPHRQRLEAAGYVPLDPFPDATTVAAR